MEEIVRQSVAEILKVLCTLPMMQSYIMYMTCMHMYAQAHWGSRGQLEKRKHLHLKFKMSGSENASSDDEVPFQKRSRRQKTLPSKLKDAEMLDQEVFCDPSSKCKRLYIQQFA